MTQSLDIKISINKDEYFEFIWSTYMKSKINYFLLFVLFSVFAKVIITIVDMIKTHENINEIILKYFPLLFMIIFLVFFAKKHLKKYYDNFFNNNRYLYIEKKYSFTSEEITIIYDENYFKIKIKDISKLIEYKNIFYIPEFQGNFVIIPKRVFATQNDLEFFKSIFQDKIRN